jgi:hypothetical protein
MNPSLRYCCADCDALAGLKNQAQSCLPEYQCLLVRLALLKYGLQGYSFRMTLEPCAHSERHRMEFEIVPVDRSRPSVPHQLKL